MRYLIFLAAVIPSLTILVAIAKDNDAIAVTKSDPSSEYQIVSFPHCRHDCHDDNEIKQRYIKGNNSIGGSLPNICSHNPDLPGCFSLD